jgi:hypothetical protein
VQAGLAVRCGVCATTAGGVAVGRRVEGRAEVDPVLAGCQLGALVLARSRARLAARVARRTLAVGVVLGGSPVEAVETRVAAVILARRAAPAAVKARLAETRDSVDKETFTAFLTSGIRAGFATHFGAKVT